MAFSKQLLYSPSEQIISSIADALSYPGRIKILDRLHADGSLCVQEIAEGHPICPVTLSEHLKILRTAQMITWEEKYPYTFYTIDPSTMEQAHLWMTRFLESFLRK